MTTQPPPPTPAQRLQRSLSTNPYAYDTQVASEAPTTEFAPIHHPPSTETFTHSTVTVTAIYTATIFEGADNVYRYDLPLSGVNDGWAVGPIIDQVRTMTPTQWPNIRVLIDAPGNAGSVLLEAFSRAGVQADYVDSVRQPEYTSAVYQTPTSTRETEKKTQLFHPFHAALAVVVLAVCAISWWAIGNTPNAGETTSTPSSSKAPESRDFGEGTPPPAPVDAQPPQLQDPAELFPITHGLTTVDLPQGYHVTKVGEAELITMTGNDPDFRILMAANPMAEDMLTLANIAQRVASSSELAARPDESSFGGRNVVSYMENPTDGSTAHWYVWGEAGHQMSIGCHWKYGVTPERQPDCETAVRTLRLTAEQ